MSSLLNSPAVTEWFQRLEAAWRRMPAEERTRQRDEVQQHLEGLVTAKVAQGQSVGDAWKAALSQFGDPTQIGRKVYDEWQQSRTSFRADMTAILFGLGLWALNYCLIQILFSFPLITIFTGKPYPQWQHTITSSIALETLLYGGSILIYALLGWKYPFQAIKGALFTFVLSALLGWIPIAMYVVRDNHAHLLTAMVTRTLPLMPLRLVAILMLSYFASVTKRGWYRPSLADFKITLPSRTKQISR